MEKQLFRRSLWLLLLCLLGSHFSISQSFDFEFGTTGTGNGQFTNPHKMAMIPGTDGDLYVVDQGFRIQRFNKNGTYLGGWGTLGSTDGKMNGVTGIVVDAAGNVFVADRENKRVQKFSNIGTFITKWDGTGTPDGQFQSLRGIGLDAAGNVYVVEGNWIGRVRKFDNNGGYLSKFGAFGNTDGLFNDPTDVKVDASGNIYVADQGNHRIQKFSNAGVYLMQWGTWGVGLGQLYMPWSIAFDNKGNVLVADAGNHRVQRFSNEGAYRGVWTAGGNTVGSGMGYVTGIAAYGDRMYVVDFDKNKVRVFSGDMQVPACEDQRYNLTGYFGSGGTGVGQFATGCSDIAIDKTTGYIYVADKNRIQKFNTKGVAVAQIGAIAPYSTQFSDIYGIATDAAGNLFVADRSKKKIFKFDNNGVLVTSWSVPFPFVNVLAGVATDLAGNVYTLESIGRVKKHDNNGGLLATYTLTNITNAVDIKIDPDGNILVADAGVGVVKYNSSGVYVSTIDVTSYATNVNAINVDNNGGIYLAVDYNTSNYHKVLKYTNWGDYVTQWQNSPQTGDFGTIKGVAVDNYANIYVSDMTANRVMSFAATAPSTVSSITKTSTNLRYLVKGTGLMEIIGATTGFGDGAGWLWIDDSNMYLDLLWPASIAYLQSSSCETIIVPIPAGRLENEDEELATMSVFPNPSQGQLTIKTPDDSGFDFVLYDLTGNEVMKGSSPANSYHLSNSSLNGVYYLQVFSSGEVYKSKVIFTH